MSLPSLIDTKYQPREYHRTRPRWYHSHIIDFMMANPSASLADVAKHVGKKQPTISAIVRSDMFQAALAERKRQFANLQDARISQKLTEVTIASLDTILTVLEKKKDAIPLEILNTVATGALAKLGYGTQPQAPAVQVNVQQNAAPIHTPVSNAELEAARSALRQHQRTIADSPSSPSLVGDSSDAAAPVTIEATAIEEPQK